MTMKKGEGSEIPKEEKTISAASNEEVLKALKSYQDKISELEAKIQAQSTPSGKGFEAKDILTLAEAITSKTKKDIDYNDAIDESQIPKDDYLDREHWVRFCVPKAGYIITDDVRDGMIVKLPFGKKEIFFEYLTLNRTEVGKNTATIPIATYTSKSKAEIEWLRKHKFYDTLIFESSSEAANTNAEKALRLGKIMDIIKTWDYPNVVQSAKDYKITMNVEKPDELRKSLAIAMVEKQFEDEKMAGQKRAQDAWKEDALISRP